MALLVWSLPTVSCAAPVVEWVKSAPAVMLSVPKLSRAARTPPAWSAPCQPLWFCICLRFRVCGYAADFTAKSTLHFSVLTMWPKEFSSMSSVPLSTRKRRAAVKQPALKHYGHPELSVGFNLVRPTRCWLNRMLNNRRQVG